MAFMLRLYIFIYANTVPWKDFGGTCGETAEGVQEIAPADSERTGLRIGEA